MGRNSSCWHISRRLAEWSSTTSTFNGAVAQWMGGLDGLRCAVIQQHLAYAPGGFGAVAQQYGFDDPTKATRVRDVLRGIQTLHPQPIKQAEVLQLQMLEACVEGLVGQLTSDQLAVRLCAARDQALNLINPAAQRRLADAK
jgi:hypothetical protein